jgi:hypothetical protein
MTDPTVPPETPGPQPRAPYTPPSSAPPPALPPAKGTPWGKIAIFGCGGLLLIGLVIGVIGAAIYMMNKRDNPDVVDTGPGTGIVTTDGNGNNGGVVSGGGGNVHTGTLAAGDQVAPDGSWYDEYPISGNIGDRYAVTMVSDDFDAYLTVTSPSGAQNSDDDSGGGTNSRVEVTLTEGGTYRVWANTLRPGDTGDYTLTIAPLP